MHQYEKVEAMFKGIQWYLRRGSAMSPSEIMHRIIKRVRFRMEVFGYFSAREIPKPDVSLPGGSSIREGSGGNRASVIEAAEEIMKGTIQVFGRNFSTERIISNWNSDPLSGTTAPLSFGKSINYRDEQLVGDIKYLWEPNRHLHLVTLAQAYALTNEGRYLEEIRAHLTSWLDQCPYLKGPNWTSSLELAIRLINWGFTWQLIGGMNSILFRNADGSELFDRWLRAIYQHAHFIHGNFSRYSSANNHLIGEAAGLFIASLVWPFWPAFKGWGIESKTILEREILLQNNTDGVNREQAISYQQFVLDFLIIAGLAGRDAGVEFSSDYWQRIEAMLDYLAAVMDVAGNIPMIGDADDGYVTKLSYEVAFCPYRSLLALGAILFKRSDFKRKSGHLDDKTRWLLGGASALEYGEMVDDLRALPPRNAFVGGGYYILGKDFETSREVRCIIDCGPLGYLSIAAHGHADALSLYLSVAGREFLIDPGTYCYHTKPGWRDYFRGTSAHNTLRVDGEDQSLMGGSFLWTTKASAKCELFAPGDEKDVFIGCHDGYTRLTDPVMHRREIRYLKREGKIIIADSLECRQAHLIERFWHFSEHCRVTRHDRAIVAKNGGICVRMETEEYKQEVNCYLGDETMLLGWISRRFDVKIPINTVVWKNRIESTTRLKTVITIRPGES